ncbi:PAS domain-containing hybrid sensor histidine kinase/response regulator [Planctellipticum variicoloris]|uniref:PAS domain-containing hybrid sensor histidine kinase/response regulator n=1 Tax=Planctellipticum variicoloris TaxID=3064265 RepID=UPI00301392C2|nr:PAS domain S-box protein [Planctomycetaceae bacterium SH412]
MPPSSQSPSQSPSGDSELRLAVEQARYNALIQAAADAIISITPEGCVLDFNSAAERMFRISASEIIGRNIASLMPEPFRTAHDSYLQRYLQTGERRIIGIGREVEARRSDGSIFPVELSITEVQRGDVHFFTGILRDISERKRAETSLLEANEALIRSRFEISAQASELRKMVESSRQLQEAAEAASRAKSEFLANMSHELRTPLTAILGFAELLVDDPDPAVVPEFAGTIVANGRHLLHLLTDILDLARIESGLADSVEEAASPKLLVLDVLRSFEPAVALRKLTLQHFIAPEVPETVLLDVQKFRQILSSLVDNAVKFTHSGGVLVRLLVDPLPDPPQLRVDVVDTGIGMSAGQVSELFSPFSQVDGSLTRSYGGVGLGLALSRRLSEILGGALEVSSVPGRGSTFSFWVALKTTETPTIAAPRLLTSSAMGRIGFRLEGRRILVAEDNPGNLRLLTRILKRVGASLASAENGRIAVDAVRGAIKENRPFDAILMDMQMPVMDGYAATAAIRSLGYRGPVVAVTADTTEQARKNSLAAGCDEYLTKPVDRNQLIAVLERHMLVDQLRAATFDDSAMNG